MVQVRKLMARSGVGPISGSSGAGAASLLLPQRHKHAVIPTQATSNAGSTPLKVPEALNKIFTNSGRIRKSVTRGEVRQVIEFLQQQGYNYTIGHPGSKGSVTAIYFNQERVLTTRMALTMGATLDPSAVRNFRDNIIAKVPAATLKGWGIESNRIKQEPEQEAAQEGGDRDVSADVAAQILETGLVIDTNEAAVDAASVEGVDSSEVEYVVLGQNSPVGPQSPAKSMHIEQGHVIDPALVQDFLAKVTSNDVTAARQACEFYGRLIYTIHTKAQEGFTADDINFALWEAQPDSDLDLLDINHLALLARLMNLDGAQYGKPVAAIAQNMTVKCGTPFATTVTLVELIEAIQYNRALVLGHSSDESTKNRCVNYFFIRLLEFAGVPQEVVSRFSANLSTSSELLIDLGFLNGQKKITISEQLTVTQQGGRLVPASDRPATPGERIDTTLRALAQSGRPSSSILSPVTVAPPIAPVIVTPEIGNAPPVSVTTGSDEPVVRQPTPELPVAPTAPQPKFTADQLYSMAAALTQAADLLVENDRLKAEAAAAQSRHTEELAAMQRRLDEMSGQLAQLSALTQQVSTLTDSLNTATSHGRILASFAAPIIGATNAGNAALLQAAQHFNSR